VTLEPGDYSVITIGLDDGVTGKTDKNTLLSSKSVTECMEYYFQIKKCLVPDNWSDMEASFFVNFNNQRITMKSALNAKTFSYTKAAMGVEHSTETDVWHGQASRMHEITAREAWAIPISTAATQATHYEYYTIEQGAFNVARANKRYLEKEKNNAAPDASLVAWHESRRKDHE
jgi:hypothetical protein